MIHDKIENLNRLISISDYELIRDSFLDKISPSMEEHVYPIDGDRIYAKVMSYDTKEPRLCKLEAHDKYIDIQCTIIGAEGIDVYDRSKLTISETYNPEKDVVFYEKRADALHAHTDNLEGYFTLLMPNEAHAPQQRVGDISRVKKFVIKYAVKSFYM